MPKNIVSDFYYGRIIEVSVFAAEEIVEGIADEMGVANHHVGGMV